MLRKWLMYHLHQLAFYVLYLLHDVLLPLGGHHAYVKDLLLSDKNGGGLPGCWSLLHTSLCCSFKLYCPDYVKQMARLTLRLPEIKQYDFNTFPNRNPLALRCGPA